ncbi:MAG: hypothetical protein V5A44_03185 [Haloarculaceae archaeon]
MVELLAFLGLVAVAAVTVAAVAAAGALLLNRLVDLSPREAALPSHYGGALRAGTGVAPGHCPRCGTDNDPQRSLCANCSMRLPDPHETRQGGDVNSFLREDGGS